MTTKFHLDPMPDFDDELVARIREALDQLPKLSYGSDDEPDFRPTSFETKGLEALDTLARRLEELKENQWDGFFAGERVIDVFQERDKYKKDAENAVQNYVLPALDRARSLLHPEPKEETDA